MSLAVVDILRLAVARIWRLVVSTGGAGASGGVLGVIKAAVRAFGGQVDVGIRDQV